MMTLVLALVGFAQSELTVYDGTSTNGYVPVYGFYADAYLKAEFVMPAADLAEMAGSDIYSMTFYATQTSVSWGTANFQVFLTEVGESTISAFNGPGTIVYEGALSIDDGQMFVEFETPYTYNGGNLLIGVYNTVAGSYVTSTWYGVSAEGASVQGYNYSNLDGVSPSQRNFLPKTTFEYADGAAITCPKPTGLTATLVPGNSSLITLSWTENGDATQWQICIDDDETQFITTTTNPSTLSGIVPDVTYTAKVRAYCDASDQSAWSNTVTFETTDKILIGSGTGSNANIPTNCYYNYSLTQQIYTAEEIGAAGVILGIDFQCKANVTRDLDIYMVSTDKASFSGSTDWIAVTDEDLVFSGEVAFAANVWTPIVFENAFAYDGSTNVALIVDDNTGDYQASIQFLAFDAEAQAIYVRGDNTDYDPMSSSSYNGTLLSQKNQIRLDLASATMYMITLEANPEEGGTVTGGGNAIEGRSRTITATPNDIYNFINWTKGNQVVTTEPSYTFTVTEDATYIANFELKPTVIVSNPETLDLGVRPNNAWMRPFNFTLTNTGAPAEVSSITTSNDYFTVETGDLEVPFTFDYEKTIDLGIGWGSGTGAISANVLVNFADATMAPQEIAVTATAYAPVAGDVWETAIPVTEFPYTATLNAASLPLYNNYFLPYADIEDGYDVVYQLTFTEDTYLQADIEGENGKLAIYTESFNGVGGPDVNNNIATGGGSPFEVQIGEGTSTTGYIPFYTLYNYSMSECLFLASELEEAGVTTAPMGSLSWYATNTTGYEQQGLSIWMANVDDTELTTTSHSVNDMTLVYTGAMAPEVGWNEFAFNEGSFAWDGQSNVLILVQRNNGTWNSTINWQASNVGFNATSYSYQDSGAYDVTQPNSVYTISTRPNIIMKSEGRAVATREDGDITDLTLTPGTYYLVASATSDEFSVLIDTDDVPCPEEVTYVAPANNATLANLNNLQLKWRLGANTTEYCLLVGADNASNMQVVVDWTRDLATSYTFADAINHTKYFWQVKERNDGCPEGVAGEVMSFVTPLNGATNLRIVDGSNEIMEGQALNLAWDAPADRALYYNYKLYQDGEQVYSGTNTHYTVTGLSAQTAYYTFNVVVSYYLNNEWVESGSSNSVSVYVIGMGTVSGRVFEQDGITPIVGATVTIFGYDSFGYLQTYEFLTNANGLFAGSVATGSRYQAYANAPGYQEVYYDGVIAVEQGTTTLNVNFIMDEEFASVFDVTASFVGENAYDGDAVEVTWELTPDASWHTYCENEFDNAYRNNQINTTWAYKYPADVLADYVGYSLTRVALFSDNLYGAVYGNYTCSVYVGGETPDEGLLVSTITVNVPQGMNKWVKYDLVTPVEVSENTETLWVVWNSNDNLFYPAGCTTGDNENANWWYTIEDEVLTWTHLPDICWTMMNRFEDASGRSVVLGNPSVKPSVFKSNKAAAVIGEGTTVCINEKPTVVPMAQPDRSLAYYRVYRTDWSNNGVLTDQNTVLVADNVTETSVIDETFGELEEGTYKYGVSCVYEGNRESRITWLNEVFSYSEEAEKINNVLRSGDNREATIIYDFEDGQIPSEFVNDTMYPWTVVNDAPNHTGNCIKSGNGGISSSTSAIELTINIAEPSMISFAGGCWGEGTSSAWDKCLFYIDGVQQFSYGALQTWNTYDYEVEAGEHTLRWAYTKDSSVNPNVDAFFVDDITIMKLPTPLQLERESEVTWSNPMDRGMYLYDMVDITVTLNSGDSPEGVEVYFGQEYEQYAINPLNNTLNPTLDETGYYAWDVFRKGDYFIEVRKEGYTSFSETLTIDGETHLEIELEEIIESPESLYVSRTGWAKWNGLAGDDFNLPYSGDTFEFGFEEGLEGWTTIDNDGDGLSWINSVNSMDASGYDYSGKAHGGDYFVYSQSFIDNDGAYQADNYLVTPQKYAITNGSTLSFWADNANDSYPDHFSVAIATVDNPTASDFTDIWSHTGAKTGSKASVRHNDDHRYENWRNHSVDLSAYAGQNVWIAFHHQDYDMYEIWIDDVALTVADGSNRHFETVQVTVSDLDGNVICEGETEHDYMQLPTDNLVEGELYVCTVTNIYSSGEGEISTRFRYEPCDHFLGAEELSGLAGSNGVELNWTYPGVEGPTGTRGSAVIEPEYLQYIADTDTLSGSVGTGGGVVYWGIRFPAADLHNYAGMNLTSVGIFTDQDGDYGWTYSGDYTVNVYVGGATAPGTLVSTVTDSLAGDMAWHDITLTTPVFIDGIQDLWLCFSTDGIAYPMTGCEYNGNLNSDFLSLDGITWEHSTDYGLNYTWMIRGTLEEGGDYPEPSEMGECVGAMIFRDGEVIAVTDLDSFTDEEGTIDNQYELRLIYGGTALCPFYNNAWSMSCPQTFEVTADEIIQPISFSQGWNWWSGYVELGENGLEMLEEGLGSNGLMIKSQNDGYASYLAGYGWYGSLTSIYNENTYQVRVSEACEIELAANAADPADHPITLHNGWTWIGYPVNNSMSIADALSGITPQNSDMLKSQNDGYASYLEGYGWYGSLNMLEPGMGLMYKSNNSDDVTLVYPSDVVTRDEAKANLKANDNHFVPNFYAYPDNMSVMAVVELNDEELRSERYELAAFANGEVRGSVTLSYVEPLDRYMAFLTVAGDDVTELTFGLYDVETGMEIMDCTQTINFSVNAVAGSFAEPYVVNFRGTTALDEFGKNLQVYPNPVAAGDVLSIGMVNDGTEVRVEIVNALGAVVSVENSTKVAAAFKAPSVPGVYTLRITAEGKGTYCRKLVVR